MPPSGRHHEAQRDPSSPHTNGPTIHKTCKLEIFLLVFPDQVEGQSYRVGMQLGRKGQKKFSIFISLALACHGVGRVLHVPTRPSSPAEMMTAAPQARDGQAETRAISKLMQKAAELAEQRARSGDQTEWHGRQGETREAAAEQQACATGAAERRVAAPRREHGAQIILFAVQCDRGSGYPGDERLRSSSLRCLSYGQRYEEGLSLRSDAAIRAPSRGSARPLLTTY